VKTEPSEVRLTFSADLAPFVRGERMRVKTLREKTSVKDVIESCGVPHPEVDLILVAGAPVGFAFQLTGPAHIAVFACADAGDAHADARLQRRHYPRFVADGHLGKSTRDLRLLGIDVAYEPHADDWRLLEIMQSQERALLTRDRRLLMHSVVQHGYFPRSQNTVEQTREVITRFQLRDVIAPFTRCIRCNGVVAPIEKTAVDAQLEPLTRLYYHDFRRCPDCGQVYWSGSHSTRLASRIAMLLPST
jgi:uncharacterized protein with PIN domain